VRDKPIGASYDALHPPAQHANSVAGLLAQVNGSQWQDVAKREPPNKGMEQTSGALA
jgi:hypothetical protein